MPDSGETIDVQGSDGTFSAYLARPQTPNGVTIVVLQEIFGVNANIRSIADGLAQDGYLAIAPDLYWRQAPGVELNPASEQDRGRAMDLMKGLDRDQAVGDGRAALAAACERAGVQTATAAVGYCFGGGVAYLMAVRGEVDLGIAYYGTGIHDLLDQAPPVRGQLLLHIAGDDHLCPPAAQSKIRDTLAPLGDRAQVVVYEGMAHAFARKGGAAFDKEAAERADALTRRTLETLGEGR